MANDNYDKDLKSLDDLGDKIKSLKSDDVDKKSISTSGAGLGMKIATDMVAGLLVGLFIGYQLDSYFQTKPVWLITFLIIGLGAGISNVIKTVNRIEKETKKTK